MRETDDDEQRQYRQEVKRLRNRDEIENQSTEGHKRDCACAAGVAQSGQGFVFDCPIDTRCDACVGLGGVAHCHLLCVPFPRNEDAPQDNGAADGLPCRNWFRKNEQGEEGRGHRFRQQAQRGKTRWQVGEREGDKPLTRGMT